MPDEVGRAFKRAATVIAASSRKRTGYVAMRRNNVTMIRRTLQQVNTINLSTGWGGSYDTTISPALSSCSFWQSGLVAYQPVLPNSTELINLYDQYRIKKVHLEFIFSGNNATVNAPTTCLPVLHIVNDYNSLGSANLADYQQYPDMKTLQLGVGKRIRHSFVPRVRADVMTDGGILSSSALNTTGWLDTSSSTIQHLGCKFYVNPMGLTSNTDIGTMMVLVSYDIELRQVK